MSGTRVISTISRRELSPSFFPPQGKAPKEIHAILTETLACFLPGRAKDLSALSTVPPLYLYAWIPLSMCPPYQILSQMRTALFWVITQRVMAISYRRFGKTYRSHPLGSRVLNPENGKDMLFRNVYKKLPLLAA